MKRAHTGREGSFVLMYRHFITVYNQHINVVVPNVKAPISHMVDFNFQNKYQNKQQYFTDNHYQKILL